MRILYVFWVTSLYVFTVGDMNTIYVFKCINLSFLDVCKFEIFFAHFEYFK